ncbi:unnamed protein product [Effrenium voratum]|nr:unnamed protein product [Effrenium voratum]
MKLPGPEPVHTLTGHEGAVLAMCWTKNGQYVMTASQDKSVRLWNPHSGKHIKKFVGCHNQEVNDVLIAADNSKFVSGGSDKLIFLWDVTSGQVIRKFTGHDRKVNALAFGPKEEVLLSASHDKTVKVWDMRARGHRPMQTLTGAVDSVLCLRVYGDEILTGSVDGGLRSYDVRQGQVVTDQLLQPIGSISVSNDGQCLLVSTLDSKIHLLEHQDGSELMSYSGHANKKVKVQSALDPSDSFVASGSEDGRIFFWELVEGAALPSPSGHGAAVLCLGFFEETLVTASADGAIKVWRRRLEHPAKFEELIADLTSQLEAQTEGSDEFVITDLDVSQNKLTLEQFQTLFSALGFPNIRVARFRMFGCPALNDDVVQVLCDYIQNLSPECAPSEMHLSDCAITTDGFNALCSALEETELYPKATSSTATMGSPLYLRLENNYIDEGVIQQKVDAGVLRPFTKTSSKLAPVSGPKANLVVKALNGSYAQNKGEAPAPEDAPPPKQVHDTRRTANQDWSPVHPVQFMQMFMGKAAAKGALPWTGIAKGAALAKGAMSPALLAQMTKGLPGKGKGKAALQQHAPHAQWQAWSQSKEESSSWNQAASKDWQQHHWGQDWQKDEWRDWKADSSSSSSGTSTDRSRTPVGRHGLGMLSYYWNSETGDSLWEKPEKWCLLQTFGRLYTPVLPICLVIPTCGEASPKTVVSDLPAPAALVRGRGEMSLRLQVRACGGEFQAERAKVELETSAAVLDLKIAAAGFCDLDPEVMKVISKGRVLKDEEMLVSVGLNTGDVVHIAKGMTPPAPVSSTGMEVQLKGPGLDTQLEVSSGDTVEQLREKAAKMSGLQVEEIHLLHKGKILKDGLRVDACGVGAGSLLRLARRQPASAAAAAAPAPVEEVSGAILQLAPPELQQDLELVRACVSQSGSALRFVAPELKANKDIVLQAVSSTGLALEHVARDLRDDSEVVRRAVQTTGLALEFASDRLHGDRGVVLAAVGQDGCAIQFAAPQLRDDSEVVKQAVQASGQALKHVSERLRNHREVVVLAAKQHPQSLQYASTMLRSDLSTVMDAVSASFKAFEFASDVLQENLEVIRCAARQLLASHGIFVAADEQLPSAIEANVLLVSKESGVHLLAALQTGLLTSRSFGMAVVRNDPQMYRKLEAHVKADKEVSLEAVRRLPELFLDLPFLSRSDLDIQVAAVGQKPEMISFVLKTDVHRVLDALKVQKEKKTKVEWPSGAVATTAN